MKTIEYIKNFDQKCFVIAGNVISGSIFNTLSNVGVDAIRVSVATGAACSTRNETGIYRHPVNCLKEIVNWKNEYFLKPLIVWDGGIKKPADFIKCLVLGADFVMIGQEFAACEESPALTVKESSKNFKFYRGSASHNIQAACKPGVPAYVEGFSTELEITGTINQFINRYRNGLQSAMSYLNCSNITALQSSNKNFKIEKNEYI